MKTLLPLALLASIALSACGTTSTELTGNGRVSIGIAASDANSSVTVTQTISDTGKVNYAIGDAGVVNFTFMSRPGSDAAYIRGYRVTRYNFNGTVDTTVIEDKKLDVYVPSGYSCTERTVLISCATGSTNTTAANGLPVTGVNINFAGALTQTLLDTHKSAYSEVDLEFFGVSSNGAAVVIPVTNIRSQGTFIGS